MAETEFKYDVFISYSHKDEGWADKVLRQRLDDAGLKVCIDYRDFEAGKMALLNMQDAAKESKHVVLVITRNWLNSEWSLFEALMGGTQDPAGMQKKLIPLLCEDGIQKDVNPFIAMRTWVDFTRKDREEIAWKQLFETLGKPGNLKPARLNWFYGHRYGDLENFTGRAAELNMLDEWLGNDKDNLLVLTAFGGFGKSALTWQWFNHHVDRTKWPTAIWWSFYEKEAGFESFLAETLAHLGVEVKQSARLQLNDLMEAMRGTNILIVLDGFERLLRQYGRMDAALQSDDEDADIDPSQRDCSSPLTETFLRGLSGAGLKSKVLMTTRLCPRVLEGRDGKLLKGCRQEDLQTFSPDNAVEYFHKEKINATRAEIIEVCSAYGYHPLSLSLLVGLINKSHEYKGDIVVAKNLDIFGNIKARRNHVLKYAYESLSPERRELLSKLSCFRGSMEYAVIKKVFDSPDLENSLIELRERGLLLDSSHQSPNSQSTKYDMHPIVRHYAYDHFTDEKRRKEAHVQLAMHFSNFVPVIREDVNTQDEFVPIIELYHHMVKAGSFSEAMDMYYRYLQPLFYQFGAYQLQVELLQSLFPDGEDKPPRLKNESAQAWTFNELANAYAQSGQPHRAILLRDVSIKLDEKHDNKKDLAVGLGSIAEQQLSVGALSAAEQNLFRCIELCCEIADDFDESVGRQILGRLLSYRGVWREADQELNKSFKFDKKQNDYQGLSSNWSDRALHFLLMARNDVIFKVKKPYSKNKTLAIECANHALEMAYVDAEIDSPAITNLVRGLWLLGAAYCVNDNLAVAEENLSESLNLCRQINAVDHEADILLDVARLRYAQGDFKEAQDKASEALVITERSGYVLQGADVNLFLATLALEGYRLEGLKVGSDKEAAKFHAQEALRLATCDGPPYYYKVAYEEAERMLEKLK